MTLILNTHKFVEIGPPVPEKKIFKVFTMYRHGDHLHMIGPVVSEKKKFEYYGQRRTTTTTDARAWVYYKLICEPSATRFYCNNSGNKGLYITRTCYHAV